jgi:hypothetical protein
MPKNILFLLGEPLRLTSFGSRRAIRSITRVAHFMRFAGGSATIPLASWRKIKKLKIWKFFE